MRLILIACLAAAPAFAETCPPAADHRAALDGVLVELQAAQSELEARVLNNGLWELWTNAPDARAQRLLDDGMRLIAQGDLTGAYVTLDRLVAYCPDYAEGYNQRAFASFLQQDFEAALADLDRTLEMIPDHIGALSGRGLTLMGLGREDEAQEALKAAVALNPWLNERHLIKEPDGTDI